MTLTETRDEARHVTRLVIEIDDREIEDHGTAGVVRRMLDAVTHALSSRRPPIGAGFGRRAISLDD